MIEVQKMILEVMKKQRFAASEEENKAARSVLAELKTKQIDLRTQGEITAMVQNKVIGKMRSDRENSAKEYRAAGREDLAAAEEIQAKVCAGLQEYLAPELPKALGEAEIRAIVGKVIAENPNANMGMVMKAFQGQENLDRKLVSQIANALLKK